MAVKIDIDFQKVLILAASHHKVFQFLTDYDNSIPNCFPGLEQFERQEDGTYFWSFPKVSYSGLSIQIQFYTHFNPKGLEKIEIVSVPGRGTAELNGHWLLRPENSERTELNFEVKVEADLEIPFFLKSMAEPVLKRELGKLFERYLSNVEKAVSQ